MEAFGKTILAVIIAMIIYGILKHHWHMHPGHEGHKGHGSHFDEFDPEMKKYDPSI